MVSQWHKIKSNLGEMLKRIGCSAIQLTDEGIDDPEKDLNIGLEKEGVDAQKFIVPKNGQTVRFSK